MPYHYNTKKTKKNIDIVKENKSLKEPAITGLSPKMSMKLREHAKQHKGGMASKHIKEMLKQLRAGKSFNKAHEIALKQEKTHECNCKK